MMRNARIAVLLLFSLVLCFHAQGEDAQTKGQKLKVEGKLSRVMAIGGESTGWSVEFDSETTIDGKSLHAIEIAYPKTAKLEKLANKRVRAKGRLSHRQGVETGDRTILEVSSIKELK